LGSNNGPILVRDKAHKKKHNIIYSMLYVSF